jgi:hypothetical protein
VDAAEAVPGVSTDIVLSSLSIITRSWGNSRSGGAN